MQNSNPHLGHWAWFGIVLVMLGVFYTGVIRNLDPVGDKFFFHMYPGGGDFIYPYNGARALLAGIDPYTHEVTELFDPWGRDEAIDGVMFRQFYPPTHLTAYIPLVIISDGNFRTANRLWFHLNLINLLILSIICCLLVEHIFRFSETSKINGVILFPLMLFVLGMNQGVAVSLERGQSDIFTAMLCWVGVLTWLRGMRFLPLLLIVTATLFKGYAVIFALGLFILALTEGRRIISIISGAVLPIIILAVPVMEHFPKGLEASIYRADMFWNIWYNHGYKNLIYNIEPKFAEIGNLFLFFFSLCIASLSWWKLYRAESDTRSIWMVLFACVSIITMLALSNLSVSYNLILILPGVLVLLVTQKKLAEAARLGNEGFIGVLLGLACLSLVILRVKSETFPIASLGLLGIVYMSGLMALTTSNTTQSNHS